MGDFKEQEGYKTLIESVLLPFLPINKEKKELKYISNLKNEFKESPNQTVIFKNGGIYFREKKYHRTGFFLNCNGIEFDISFLSTMNEKAVKIYNDYNLANLYKNMKFEQLTLNAINNVIIERNIITLLTSYVLVNDKEKDKIKDKTTKTYSVFSSVVENYHNMVNSTYEGNKITDAIILECSIDESVVGSELTYCDKLKQGSLTPITNDTYSTVILDGNGKILEYINMTHIDNSLDEGSISPYIFSSFTKTIENFQKQKNVKHIGIVAHSSGELLIFENKDLIFQYVKNKWSHVSFFNFNKWFLNKFNTFFVPEKQVKKLFNVLLDASFLRKGACIGIVTKEEYLRMLKNNANNVIFNIGHLLDDIEFNNCCLSSDDIGKYESIRKKVSIIKNIMKDYSFNSIDRVLFSELLALDGATLIVIDENLWAIKFVGTLIELRKQGESGGRQAAAKTISDYGIGIKVSTDGDITIYENGEIKLIM